jgi:hypothetical protein
MNKCNSIVAREAELGTGMFVHAQNALLPTDASAAIANAQTGNPDAEFQLAESLFEN